MARRRPLLRALLLTGVLCAALTGGAASQSPGPPDVATPGALEGTNWSLTGMAAGGVTTPIPSGAAVNLDFVAGEAGGSTGCNQYSAPYTIDGATLSFGAVTATRQGCDEAGTALEAAYVSALATSASYLASGGTLTLMDAAGATLLTFSTTPMPGVEGTWAVTGFSDGSAVVPVAADQALTLAFRSDGHAAGHGGCNQFGGPYGVSEDQIAIGPLMSTLQSCGQDVDSREEAYLAALQQAISWNISSDSLELRDSEGAPLVRADRVAAP